MKIIRDKQTGLPAGYGFVEFSSHEVAAQVLQTYNGTPIPGTHRQFRLNWGQFQGQRSLPMMPNQQREGRGSGGGGSMNQMMGNMGPQGGMGMPPHAQIVPPNHFHPPSHHQSVQAPADYTVSTSLSLRAIHSLQ